MFYVLICRECGDDLDIPFDSPEARGRWASEHTKATGHERWFVCDVTDAGETAELLARHDEFVADMRSPGWLLRNVIS